MKKKLILNEKVFTHNIVADTLKKYYDMVQCLIELAAWQVYLGGVCKRVNKPKETVGQ